MATARARHAKRTLAEEMIFISPPCEGERKGATVPEAFVKAFQVFGPFSEVICDRSASGRCRQRGRESLRQAHAALSVRDLQAPAKRAIALGRRAQFTFLQKQRRQPPCISSRECHLNSRIDNRGRAVGLSGKAVRVSEQGEVVRPASLRTLSVETLQR